MTAVPELTVLTLEATYRALTPVNLPDYPATTFRGALGRALRHLTCTTQATHCGGCRRIARCTFGSLWSYVVPTESGALLEVANAYLVFSDPRMPQSLREGSILRFSVRLFGVARGNWQTIVDAMRLAGEAGFGALRGGSAGECDLVEVIAVGERQQRTPVYDRERGTQCVRLAPSRHAPYPSFEHAGSLRLELLSPLALSPRHVPGTPPPRAVLDRFDPARMTELLMRRWRDLVLHHEHQTVDWDVAQLEEDAAVVRVVEHARLERNHHFSQAQGRSVSLDGLTGRVIVDHVTPALAGLWRLAELVHVGRGAVKGLGRIRMEPV